MATSKTRPAPVDTSLPAAGISLPAHCLRNSPTVTAPSLYACLSTMWKPSFEDVQPSRLVIHCVPFWLMCPPTLAIAGTISTTITTTATVPTT